MSLQVSEPAIRRAPATDEARRGAMDRAMDRRIAEIPPEARAWLARARKLQPNLLELWIAGL